MGCCPFEGVHHAGHPSDTLYHVNASQEVEQSSAMLRVGAFKSGSKDEAQGFKREKNWGFVDEEGALMIYYALLPCTVVLEFDMGQPDGAILRSRACYDDQAADIEQQTGRASTLLDRTLPDHVHGTRQNNKTRSFAQDSMLPCAQWHAHHCSNGHAVQDWTSWNLRCTAVATRSRGT